MTEVATRDTVGEVFGVPSEGSSGSEQLIASLFGQAAAEHGAHLAGIVPAEGARVIEMGN